MYALTDSLLSWTNAEDLAVELGGNLVTINDANEQQFLVDSLINANTLYWIGLNDVQSEGNFVWSSGEAVSYTNWYSGEPSNSGGAENYTAINWGGRVGSWNDLANNGAFNSNPLAGIIEIITDANYSLLPSRCKIT